MFETVLADIAQQFLHSGNTHHARAAEGLERIARELAFTHITADGSPAVVGRETRVAHGAALHAAHAGAKSIFPPNCARDDLLEVHFDILEEMLRQIAAMEADGLVR